MTPTTSGLLALLLSAGMLAVGSAARHLCGGAGNRPSRGRATGLR